LPPLNRAFRRAGKRSTHAMPGLERTEWNMRLLTTLPRRARRRGSGLFLAFLTEYLLTNPAFPAILPPVNAMMRTSSAAQSCQENPRMVEGGEGGGVNTSLSSGPKRRKPWVGSAGRARYSAEVLPGTS